jgi:hypothetical protein
MSGSGGDFGPRKTSEQILQEAIDSLRRDLDAIRTSRTMVGPGCICPPTSEQTCMASMCPRRPIMIRSTMA